MIQIIGWLGCVYLAVKALEFAASSAYRDEQGLMKPFAIAAAILAWLSSAAFALMFAAQGATVPGAAPDHVETPFTKCLDSATTAEDINACSKHIGT